MSREGGHCISDGSECLMPLARLSCQEPLYFFCHKLEGAQIWGCVS